MSSSNQTFSNSKTKFCTNIKMDLRECASQITDSINTRIYDRNLPSQTLQPQLSVRPVMTKYSLMPVVDPRKPICENFAVQPTYNQYQIFNPGQGAPYNGYNPNVESELRNQIYALQSCPQSVFVPSSDSDLYKFQFQPCESSKVPQQFQELFKQERFNSFNPNPENIGQSIFNNHTRQETKTYVDKVNCI